MKYCDLHCDTLTAQRDQVTAEKLGAGDCLLQCFAVFLSPECPTPLADALALCGAFDGMCAKEGLHPVRRAADVRADRVNAMLTLEGGEAIEGDLNKLNTLYARGVRMCALTWNFPNALGYPSRPAPYKGDALPQRARESARGLTPFGREAVAQMRRLGMIVDVSHGSDRLVHDVAEVLQGAPFVASHSNSAAVHDCARNLRDEEIRLIADCGGVVGLNFCANFLTAGRSAEDMRRAIMAHAAAIMAAGGEDVLALGSDFDGIPPNPFLPDCTFLPALLEAFCDLFGFRIAEKIARKNFLRVLRDVCG